MKTLRKRLTGLYTMTAGALFLLVIAAFLFSSVHEDRNSRIEQFTFIWNSLSSRFLSSSSFSHSFLAETEASYRMIIHIQENGYPFRYPGSWTPKTDRDYLIRCAGEEAEKEGVFMNKAPVSSTFSTSSLIFLQGLKNEHYYARVLSVATKQGVKSICAILYIPSLGEALGGTILYLCLLAVLGIIGLWLISWKFVGWSLIPVEENQKKQAQFIAAASHELRSPLAVLRSAAAAIAISPEKMDMLIPLMDSECVRMSRLIEDMLLLASADAKTWSLQWEEVDMDTLLIDLFETFQPVCKEKGITLWLKLPEEALLPVWGDPDRIRQILMVLLDNARNFTPEGKSIYLCAQAEKKKQRLVLQVIDEGCGISPESRPYIFERFYQADSARSDKQHFGLGLSIAKELVGLHRGSIGVDEDKEGRNCFTVTLPLSKSSYAHM